MHRRKSDERGAAAVEFAVIATFVLLPLLAGIIQYSIYFWGYQAGANGAREGARAYAVDPCNDHTDLIANRIGAASAGNLEVDADVPAEPEAGDFVTVVITFDPQVVAGGIIPMPDKITQSATARIEDVEDC